MLVQSKKRIQAGPAFLCTHNPSPEQSWCPKSWWPWGDLEQRAQMAPGKKMFDSKTKKESRHFFILNKGLSSLNLQSERHLFTMLISEWFKGSKTTNLGFRFYKTSIGFVLLPQTVWRKPWWASPWNETGRGWTRWWPPFCREGSPADAWMRKMFFGVKMAPVFRLVFIQQNKAVWPEVQ